MLFGVCERGENEDWTEWTTEKRVRPVSEYYT